MPKISPVKSPIAQHLKDSITISSGKSPLNKGKNIKFYNKNGEHIGSQTLKTKYNRLDNDTLEKRTVIKREIFEGFPQKIYEQYIIIESKIKQFLGKTEVEDYLLPTEIKTTDIIIDKQKNTLTKNVQKRILENNLKKDYKYGMTFHTMEGKPKFSTVSATTETQPYEISIHDKNEIFKLI